MSNFAKGGANMLLQDYKYCENIIKINSKSFYAAFSILPTQKRNSIYAIYAFCRFADDSVDILNSKESLLSLENSLKQLIIGNTPNTPIFRALSHTFNSYDIDTEPFYDMIRGQLSDFEFVQPNSLKDLSDYSYYVAGTVGLMLLPIIATENQNKLKTVAKALGEAMQFTNILRDVGEDYDSNRIYLPAELLNKFPNSLEAIKTKTVNYDFIKCWEYLAKLAEENYDFFFKHLYLFDLDSQKAVAKSALYYSEILNVIRKNNYNCLNKRQYVSSFDRLGTKLKVLLSKY